ncbi:DUF2917 domain-containing protein [Herbaspirillum frisingense]|uniref:DUF2917 domain-containing protein n=1 Tax=Herbaspirillum frisingense TaxID=92645 RepID=UPI0016028793|nr:DUF2917 domain-containing protein [Herbaspirillum frisingense]QNB09708.1 DUF2917 domain-containing protein [Herbaspirillum frisingense]
MAISFADQTIPERLLEGQTQTRRLRGGVRIRVTSGLVWLTIAGCRQDIWLAAGRCFDYHGRGLAILEAVHGAAEFTVSPLRRAGWRGWLSGAGSAIAPQAPLLSGAEDGDTVRINSISKLLPHGLIRWF